MTRTGSRSVNTFLWEKFFKIPLFTFGYIGYHLYVVQLEILSRQENKCENLVSASLIMNYCYPLRPLHSTSLHNCDSGWEKSKRVEHRYLTTMLQQSSLVTTLQRFLWKTSVLGKWSKQQTNKGKEWSSKQSAESLRQYIKDIFQAIKKCFG